MFLRDGEDVQRVERRAEGLVDIAVLVEELKKATPVGVPVQTEVQDVCSKAALFLGLIRVSFQEVARLEPACLAVRPAYVLKPGDLPDHVQHGGIVHELVGIEDGQVRGILGELGVEDWVISVEELVPAACAVPDAFHD